MKEKEYIKNSNDWSFTYINYTIFLIGVLFVLCGYILMYTGEVNSVQSTKISPFFLIFGYCILIPIALIYKKK